MTVESLLGSVDTVSPGSQPLEWLYLPTLVRYRLGQQGIDTIDEFLALSLHEVTSDAFWSGMSARDWLVLVRMVRRTCLLAKPDAPFSGLVIRPQPDDLDLPLHVRAVLGRYGVADAGELQRWSLRHLIAIAVLSSQQVARILAAVRSLVGTNATADEEGGMTDDGSDCLDPLVSGLLSSLRPQHALVLLRRLGLEDGNPLTLSAKRPGAPSGSLRD